MRINFYDIFLPHKLSKLKVRKTDVYILKNRLGYRLGFGYTGNVIESDVLTEGYLFFDITSIKEVLVRLRSDKSIAANLFNIPLYHPDITDPLSDPYYLQKIDVLRAVQSKGGRDCLFEDIYLPHKLQQLPKEADDQRGYIVLNKLDGLLGSTRLFDNSRDVYSQETMIEKSIIEKYAVNLDYREGVSSKAKEIILWNPRKTGDPLRDSAYIERLQLLSKIWS